MATIATSSRKLQYHWDEVSKAVLEVYTTGKILKEMNVTYPHTQGQMPYKCC